MNVRSGPKTDAPLAQTTAGDGEILVNMDRILTKVQRINVLVLATMLVIVLTLSTIHLGILICEQIMAPPRFLISVPGLLEVFGYFLLVLIGVELIETLKCYVREDVVHVRVVLEVALIAMARKVIIAEPDTMPSVTLFGIAALILALGLASYFERTAKPDAVNLPSTPDQPH